MRMEQRRIARWSRTKERKRERENGRRQRRIGQWRKENGEWWREETAGGPDRKKQTRVRKYMRGRRKGRERKRQNVRRKLKGKRKKRVIWRKEERARTTRSNWEFAESVRGAEGERRREKRRVVEAWQRRERERGTRNAGIDSRRQQRQPAWNTPPTAPSRLDSETRRKRIRESARGQRKERGRRQKGYVISIGSSLQIALKPLQTSLDIFGQSRNAIKPSLHKPNIYFLLGNITVTCCYVTVTYRLYLLSGKLYYNSYITVIWVFAG